MSIPAALLSHRFGYGPRAGQLSGTDPASRLREPDAMAAAFPGLTGAEAMAVIAGYRDAMRAHEPGSPAARTARRAAVRDTGARAAQHARVDLARAVAAEDGYRERLVRFWTDHFTVSSRRGLQRPLLSAFGDDAIRPHVAGRFADMLRAAVLHPAMLGYLDQTASVGPGSTFGLRRGAGVNENLARELLELHTLGVDGGYSQADVRQMALLLTGLAVNGLQGTVFEPKRAEPGAETVLGRRYGGDGPARIEDILTLLDDLAAHPATARHLSWKLAVHFVADEPDPGLVADLTAEWLASGGDLYRMAVALCAHPAALSPVLAKARQPFDFIVAALRALDVDPQTVMGWTDRDLRRIALQPMALMGQRWQTPGGPDGWPEAVSAWITPQALATRIDWAMTVPAVLRDPLPDARAFVDLALADMADDRLRALVAGSESNIEGVGLVLASPAFNRR